MDLCAGSTEHSEERNHTNHIPSLVQPAKNPHSWGREWKMNPRRMKRSHKAGRSSEETHPHSTPGFSNHICFEIFQLLLEFLTQKFLKYSAMLHSEWVKPAWHCFLLLGMPLQPLLGSSRPGRLFQVGIDAPGAPQEEQKDELLLFLLPSGTNLLGKAAPEAAHCC